ncbi:Imm1 family immunity protein [Kitasatospora sp. NPDC017646]|uniref:Imm1 family immunity protein n=1 Tax=Kitasatospora sp. NPDC017646 TaxID=3364024 RepID=UPI003790DD90
MAAGSGSNMAPTGDVVEMSALAEVRYRSDQMENPGHLHSIDDVDALIDALLNGPANQNMAQLTHLARKRVKPKISGYDFPSVPDHDFQVGVNRELQVGVVLFIDHSGNFVSAGPPDSRESPEYYLAGHWTQFRDQTEISIDLVRQAVREFLVTGGQRPACIAWKNQYVADDSDLTA